MVSKLSASFWQNQSLLCSYPELKAPEFTSSFSLAVDASDHGIGADLFQVDRNSMEHSVKYFFRKFNTHQKNDWTVEKETLVLLLSLQHFGVYVSTSQEPILVYTDHNPLTFLGKMKNRNRRLLYLQRRDILLRYLTIDQITKNKSIRQIRFLCW